jgi:hypothetical protein
MDPLTLGAVVAALVAKATDQAEDGAVSAASSALSRLVGWLRTKLDGDAGKSLQRVEDADSPSRLQALASEIDRRASTDEAFREELKAMVREAQDAGVDVRSASQVAWGHHNVQAANISDSDIRVTFGGDQPQQ